MAQQKGIDDYDVFMKIILVGDSGVGKTNIVTRVVRNEFDPSSETTIGIEFATKTVNIDGQVVKAQIWDTAGQERYHALVRPFYRGAKGALVVYDVTLPSSFASVKRWLNLVREHNGDNLVIMLVGNKTDLAQQRAVSTESGRALAEKEGLLFMETSAADGSNVEPAFRREIQEIFNMMKGRSRLQSEESSGPALPPGVRIPLGANTIRQPQAGRSSGCCS